MADLPTNYLDDILAVSMGGKRKFKINHENGSIEEVTIEDISKYDQVGSVFGAGDINRTNQAVNEKFDSGDVVDPMLTTEEGFAADAYKTKLQFDELNSNLNGVSFVLNEDGTIAGYTSGGADTVHPFINKTKYDEILQTTKNLWRLEIADRCSNTLEAFAGQTVKSVKIIDDTMTSTSWNITDYYTGKATTNVYVNSDINLSCTLSADDSGALYVNGNFVANAGTVTLPLKAGWNEVIVIYTDNTSYEGWVFNPKFSANSNIVEVNLHTHDI